MAAWPDSIVETLDEGEDIALGVGLPDAMMNKLALQGVEEASGRCRFAARVDAVMPATAGTTRFVGKRARRK
ncbi:hypothetical protein XI09_08215 [Bradyrhizobium sp. CCBAU 11386]|uniref:hypothetical protein n=1 Tax=Bradyrhizobium sp. CCBAU 11386 TaxID=1630837 RepID=UPI002303669B|nr:hypothetical protein [Bradyrhizobium sp. CCBAU 11386]MDA9504718.1 hypothetical protein [Bradyrhizobium sp. CCBAU 11386]